MELFDELLAIARRKNNYDATNPWAQGSETYFEEIGKEIEEVREELPLNRVCYLEDELGDVLWDYLNILLALEQEKGIDAGSVLARACRKYEERISGIEKGIPWKETKEKQKVQLRTEQNRFESGRA
ncbi:MAG: hypothetical protein JXA95_12565 [Spirochaetales bacterium]|nr:hypothetical protein [Spirochaetales bacterium]